MKQAMNFRLDTEVVTVLTVLEEKLHTSKTRIVEEAVRLYAKKKLPVKNSLLKYAGSINDEDAAEMLKVIRHTKHNKDLKSL